MKNVKKDFLEPSCGNCKYYKPLEQDEKDMHEMAGECFFMPPVPVLTEDGLVCLRPLVEDQESPCGFHQFLMQ